MGIRPSPLYYFKHEKDSEVGCVALAKSNRFGDLLGKGGVLREEIPGQRFPSSDLWLCSCTYILSIYITSKC